MEAASASAGRVVGGAFSAKSWSTVTAAAFGLGCVVYLVICLVNLHTFIGHLYLNADVAVAAVIGELFGGRGPHAITYLGNHPWYATLIWETATKGLPFHRQLWEAGPFFLQLLLCGLVGWGLWRLAGYQAALYGGGFLLLLSTGALLWQLQPDSHSLAWFADGLCGVAALEIARQRGPRSGPKRLFVLAIGGCVTGFFLSSDSLALISGIAPFLIATVLTSERQRKPALRRAAEVGTFLAATFLVAEAVRHAMHTSGVEPTPFPPGETFVALENLGHNITLYYQALSSLLMGSFFGAKLTVETGIYLLAWLAGIYLLFLAVATARRSLMGELGNGARGPAVPQRAAWIAFWLSSAALLSLSFLTGQAPTDLNSSRYLGGIPVAIAALYPLAQGRLGGVKATAVAAATIWAVGANLNLLSNWIPDYQALPYSLVNQVEALAAKNHAPVGYANYWAASPITWGSNMKVLVLPVENCGPNLCQYRIGSISSYYKPRPGVHSFLLDDPAAGPPPVSPPATLGPPTAEYHLGQTVIWVYPYDIGAKVSLASG